MIKHLLRPQPLSELRNELNLSQSKLARNLSSNSQGLKFSQSLIALYELGLRKPSLNRATLIANYFNLPIEAIIFGPYDYSEQSKLTGS